MKYIKLENDTVVPYSIEQLFIDYPNAVIFKGAQMPSEELLKDYNVYPLITEPYPEIKEDEIAEESIPIYKENEWHQNWVVRKLSEEEIEKIIESRSIDYAIKDTETKNQASFLAEKDVQIYRYDICKSCPSLTTLKTCKECGCIMPLKVKLAQVSCPLNKWNKVN